MALQTSGPISLNDIHVEAGGGSGTNCTINDADIRGLIGKGSGATMSFNEWYGASAQLNLAMTLSYFQDTDQYGTTYRQCRFRKKAGITNEGDLVPNYWTLPNGNKLEMIWMQYNYPSFGAPPNELEFQALMYNSSGTLITNPANTGWETMIYVSANDGRTLKAKRSEMAFTVESGTSIINWRLLSTTGTTTAGSTLFGEYVNPNNNEIGTLEVVV